jgi:UDP-N-acetylglucosamine 3-dehydrogenase
MLRVGILGAGGMGNTHARQYRKMPDVELTFHDRDPAKAEGFSQTYDCSSCDSIDQLIQSVDVVDVCLPNDMHLEFGLKAISAGRAVFMEKPLARTLEEGRQLVQAARKQNVPCMPGQVVRFFPEFARGNALVRQGRIGTAAAARTRRGGPAPSRGSENWFMDHARSGGVIVDLAVHDFDWLRWTLGEVTQVYARSLGVKQGAGADYALITLSFEGGAVAHVEATWMDPSGFRTAYEVCGSEGMIQFDSRTSRSLRTHQAGSTALEAPLAPLDDPFYRQLRAFVNAVKAGEEPPVTVEDGFLALSIAWAALESARTDQAKKPEGL